MSDTLLTIDVSHGTTHDGPGMRTTVFVKGCSLHCMWCQNPESINPRNEVWWDRTLCIGCLSCKDACPTGALRALPEGIVIDRTVCKSCLSCADACPATAMSPAGQEYDMDAIMKELLKDRTFYKEFGGGVTCSGGEPLLQYEFLTELFRNLQAEGITTALDTCGCAPRKNLEAILPYTNYILYDMKIFDGEKHKLFTGQSNDRILENLLYAADYVRHADHPMEIWIRTPLIPGATAIPENLEAIGKFLSENLMDVLGRWEMCAFNGACAAKYQKLGRRWEYEGKGTMTQGEIESYKAAATKYFPKDKLIVTGMIRPDGGK